MYNISQKFLTKILEDLRIKLVIRILHLSTFRFLICLKFHFPPSIHKNFFFLGENQTSRDEIVASKNVTDGPCILLHPRYRRDFNVSVRSFTRQPFKTYFKS